MSLRGIGFLRSVFFVVTYPSGPRGLRVRLAWKFAKLKPRRTKGNI